MKPSQNTACFASGAECKAITSRRCDGCSFEKPRKQLADERKRSAERLRRKGLLDYCQAKYGLNNSGEPLPAED